MPLTETAALVAADAGRHWDGDGPPGFWPIFPILWLLIIGGVIAAIVVTRRRTHRMAPARAGEARLSELFAAGEIGEEEFRARRSVLRER